MTHLRPSFHTAKQQTSAQHVETAASRCCVTQATRSRRLLALHWDAETATTAAASEQRVSALSDLSAVGRMFLAHLPAADFWTHTSIALQRSLCIYRWAEDNECLLNPGFMRSTCVKACHVAFACGDDFLVRALNGPMSMDCCTVTPKPVPIL